jgi:hypothetical protein
MVNGGGLGSYMVEAKVGFQFDKPALCIEANMPRSQAVVLGFEIIMAW